jgi:protein tyrosine phosphatase (PTP) superfamily phosphohydrolase (DUF442 family)
LPFAAGRFHRGFRVGWFVLASCAFLVQPGYSQDSGDQDSGAATQSRAIARELVSPLPRPVKLASEHLPNLIRVHPDVFSGGLPANDAAFAELKRLGVKTVISVDGATPDVAAAKRVGMRYVHLPHGYDGIPHDRAKELAKAVRDLDGPIYIHCHHGKHRSPAAASVACVSAGLVPKSQAVAILELAGTNPNYRGLYRSARRSTPMASGDLDRVDAAFPEVAEIPPMADAMVELSHTFDHVRLIQANGWKTPPRHPDLLPAHEALLLREHFTELLRSEEVKQQPADYREIMAESESAARVLEHALADLSESDRRSLSDGGKLASRLGRAVARVRENCKACHRKYRDLPLD